MIKLYTCEQCGYTKSVPPVPAPKRRRGKGKGAVAATAVVPTGVQPETVADVMIKERDQYYDLCCRALFMLESALMLRGQEAFGAATPQFSEFATELRKTCGEPDIKAKPE